MRPGRRIGREWKKVHSSATFFAKTCGGFRFIFYLCMRKRDFPDLITNYNIEARYPEDKEALARSLTSQFCRQMIDDTKQLQQWIKDKL